MILKFLSLLSSSKEHKANQHNHRWKAYALMKPFKRWWSVKNHRPLIDIIAVLTSKKKKKKLCTLAKSIPRILLKIIYWSAQKLWVLSYITIKILMMLAKSLN